MPAPKLNTVVRRPDLGGAIIEMMEASGDAGYIGSALLPSTRVNENAGVYPVIPKEALMKNVNPARAPKAAYVRTSYEYERGTYMTYEYGVEEVVDDVERALFDQEASGMADMLAAKRAADFLMRAKEKRVADMLFSATTVSRLNTAYSDGSHTPTITNEWDDFANAVPITDVKTALPIFRKGCGMLPDALVVSWTVYNNLTQCAQIKNQLLYTFPGLDISNLTTDQIARVLGVPRLIVGGGLQDTNGFGLDASVSDIWSDEYAALVRIGDLSRGGLGRTFVWTRDSGDLTVEQYREESVRGDVYRVRQYVGENLFASYNTSGSIVSDVFADNCILFDNVTTH
jgi:hypothetical protein